MDAATRQLFAPILPWLLAHTISQFGQVGMPLHVVFHGRLNAVDSVIVVDSWNNYSDIV